MTTISPNPEDLIAAFSNTTDLNFDLPDPEDETIAESEFQVQLEQIWLVCDRFDLQTDIWRGRVLRAIRDREKKGGDGRGTGFLNWLKTREITKSQAYALIQLANSADTLLSEGKLDPSSINNFSKRAFVLTAKSVPEVQQLVSEAAQQGEKITRREVQQLSDQWTSLNSELLPPEIKEKASDGSLPPRHLAPLVRELEKLPDIHLKEIQDAVANNPDVDTVKQVTSQARSLAKYLDLAGQVQTLNHSNCDLELALDEALRLDVLSNTSELVKQANQLEQSVAKVYTTWKRLRSLADRLYVDTGASNPHLRAMLTSLEVLTGELIQIQLDETGEHLVRLQIFDDNRVQ